MFTPLSVASRTAEADRASFADDVEYYLSLAPRQLPSRYFYDEVGSALFETICRLPWYGITRAERRLLERHAAEIFASAGRLTTLIELGPGGGEKLLALVSAHAPTKLTVHLVDVSQAALDAASQALATLTELTVQPHQGTYELGLARFAQLPRAGRTMALFLGSNIGNFDPPGADEFLRSIRATLSPGDSLLLGADMVKPEGQLLLAYDDPLGVTAAFNLNLLSRVNRELDADFDLKGFAHRSLWNAEHSRVEMHLVSLTNQRVRVPRAANLEIAFEQGEVIWTESSYKYRPEGIATMLDQAGFDVAGLWIDDGFALTLGEAR